MELLNKIQRELKVPKSQFNAFSKYHYRNAEDILEAVKPLLGETGALILEDEVVQLGDRYYVIATATLFENGKEHAHATAYAREALDKKGMDEAQITGAASSYARKYALNGLFCIDDTKDADNEDNSKKEVAVGPSWKQLTPTELKSQIKALIDAKVLNPISTKEEYEAYVVENTGLTLTPENYQEIINILSK